MDEKSKEEKARAKGIKHIDKAIIEFTKIITSPDSILYNRNWYGGRLSELLEVRGRFDD